VFLHRRGEGLGVGVLEHETNPGPEQVFICSSCRGVLGDRLTERGERSS